MMQNARIASLVIVLIAGKILLQNVVILSRKYKNLTVHSLFLLYPSQGEGKDSSAKVLLALGKGFEVVP